MGSIGSSWALATAHVASRRAGRKRRTARSYPRAGEGSQVAHADPQPRHVCVGEDLRERDEHEGPLVQPRVGEAEPGLIELDRPDKEQVEVEGSRLPAKPGRPRSPMFALDLEQVIEELPGSEPCPQNCGGIEVVRLGFG